MKPLYICLFVIMPVSVWAQEEYLSKKLTREQCVSLAAKYETEGDIKEATRYLNTAAMMQWELKDYESAINYFNQSITLNQRIDNASGIAKLNSNLGMIYSDLRDFEKSLSYFQRALKYRIEFGEKSEIISTYINKAVVQNSLLRHTEAAQSLEEALRLATEMNDAAQMKSCYGMLAETYEKAGDQAKTIHYFNLYRTFHEMVQRNRINEAKKETEAARTLALESELAKREKELALLNASRALQEAEANIENMSAELRALMESKTKQDIAQSLIEQELELDKLRLEQARSENYRQKIWIAVAIAGTLLLAILTFILYRNYRYKKKTNRKLAEQNEEITGFNMLLERKVQQRTSELERTLNRLEKRNRDLDQFSHIISHNLRGPVANILGLGKVINRSNPADPFNTEVFDRTVSATHALDAVVKDLGVILQVEYNQEIPKEELNVNVAIDDVRGMMSVEIAECRPTIHVVPDAPTVQTFKPYFESILYNLLSNAFKYCTENTMPVIEIRTRRDGNDFVLQVSDNGIGIAPADIERIFEPYKRLTSNGHGKGLGLYLVRTQVESLGGTVAVTSQVGKGSTFTVRLPQHHP